ncbi:MAG TPA: glutamate-1-semialdehyde 2,1-aminomutase [Gemmatimonadota bacterium]|nr:glutamate-1-semialdehyde 2,1-aminomutase [Gemmatimonadota bacterium]
MTFEGDTSETLFARARELFPGGVNSPVRAWGAVGGTPLFIARAAGARMWDVEGNEYLDWVSSWGAILLGHAHPAVVEAVREAASRGTTFGAPTPGEVRLGERIRAAMPAVERMRFTSSGTEAVMSAVRLARAFTGRSRIVKFAGCYHGHADALLAQSGSGVATLGLPDSAGVPEAATRDTVVAPYNDIDAVTSLFREIGDEIAAVVVEPVAANMGVVLPLPGFLSSLRELTARHGALLVFDEVITGFRLGPGGAQGRFQVAPDLTCLGKIIGGGLPVGAFGGRSEIMARLAPEGPTYQAGTLSGNPLAMAAGNAALEALAADPTTYETLDERAARLATGLEEAGGGRVSVSRAGALLTVFFAAEPPVDYERAKASDTAAFARFFHAMRERGVLLPPSAFEAWFPTLAHGEAEIEATLEAAREALPRALDAA